MLSDAAAQDVSAEFQPGLRHLRAVRRGVCVYWGEVRAAVLAAATEKPRIVRRVPTIGPRGSVRVGTTLIRRVGRAWNRQVQLCHSGKGIRSHIARNRAVAH